MSPSTPPSGAGSPGQTDPPLLAFAQVTKRYPADGREVAVLEEVSFTLRKGSSVGLYGGRRSGKSTLLRLAAGIEQPDAGTIAFMGRELGSTSARERARLLRSSIALLSLSNWAPAASETALDHVATALGSTGLSVSEARRRGLLALEQVGLGAASAGREAASLPLGERARVMLAQALVREPRLLLVDEPAPLPGPVDQRAFCQLLRGLARERGIAVLIASEELASLDGAGALLTLSAGRLLHTGTEREGGSGSTVVQGPWRAASAGSS